MKTLAQKMAVYFLAVYSLLLMACSSDKDISPQGGTEQFTIEAAYRNVEVDRPAVTLQIPVKTNLSLDKWNVSQEGTWFTASKGEDSEKVPYIEIKVRENTTGEKRMGTITARTESKLNSQQISIIQHSDGQSVAEDIRVKPIDAKASSWETAHSNQGIDMTIDGDYSTHFHSPWNGTKFPITLEYFFNGDNVIDYIIYHSRNGNGNFGKFTLYVATDASHTYSKVDDYDFYENNAPSKIDLKGSIKPTAIKFEVKSGYNDFVSCAEMEFWQTNSTNTLNDEVLTVFTDLSCSELRKDVTDEKINALSDYFSRLAKILRDNSYTPLEKDFRIRDYEAYSIASEWRNKLMTRCYSSLDNPTGMTVKAGDEIIVCVGDTHGNSVALQCLGEELVKDDRGNYYQPAESGDTYLLKEGVNKVKIRNEGQLFVMYNVPDILSADAKPIRIHFPPGAAVVNGFFDLKEHKTDDKYAEIIANASHKYFCVRGNTFIMYFSRTKMPQNKIIDALDLWDSIAEWEQEFCGIDEFRGEGGRFNNHLYGMSPEADNNQLHLWASEYRMAFIYTVLGKILISKEEANSSVGSTWGAAHEMGHVHQQAINWDLCTETSANVFAHYVCERLGKYTSHGPGLRRLAIARKNNGGSWFDICVNSANYNHINNRMWWQLYIYYTKVRGMDKFYANVFKEMREVNIDPYDRPGEKQMEFIKACSKVAGEDLSEFFDLWGLFVPTNETSPYTLKVTSDMVTSTKEYLSQFPKPKHALQYIEDRKMVGYLDGDFDRADIGDLGFFDTFKENPQLSENISATVSGRTVTVSNASEAVAIEIRRSDDSGDIVFFSNFTTFEIPSDVNTNGCRIYAVRANGDRRHLADL